MKFDLNDLSLTVKKRLAREFAKAGGEARAKKLTAERRVEIASKGGKAGGRGRKK